MLLRVLKIKPVAGVIYLVSTLLIWKCLLAELEIPG